MCAADWVNPLQHNSILAWLNQQKHNRLLHNENQSKFFQENKLQSFKGTNRYWKQGIFWKMPTTFHSWLVFDSVYFVDWIQLLQLLCHYWLPPSLSPFFLHLVFFFSFTFSKVHLFSSLLPAHISLGLYVYWVSCIFFCNWEMKGSF